jgi:hypothetical protein
MSRHPGIGLAALEPVLVLALAACTATDDVRPTQPNSGNTSTTSGSTTAPAPSTTGTGDFEIVVAHPKQADETTRCDVIVPAADVGAATGATAKLREPITYGCEYVLTNADGKYAGRVVAAFYGAPPLPSADRPTTVTILFGNTAVQEQLRDERESCSFMVVLDSQNPWERTGAVLEVHGSIETGVDPCQAVRALVEKGFARLPDA